MANPKRGGKTNALSNPHFWQFQRFSLGVQIEFRRRGSRLIILLAFRMADCYL